MSVKICLWVLPFLSRLSRHEHRWNVSIFIVQLHAPSFQEKPSPHSSTWDKKSGTMSTTSEQTGCNFDQVYDVTNIAGMSEEHLSSNYILYVLRRNCVFAGGFPVRQGVRDHEHYFWTKTGLNRTTNKKENVQHVSLNYSAQSRTSPWQSYFQPGSTTVFRHNNTMFQLLQQQKRQCKTNSHIS